MNKVLLLFKNENFKLYFFAALIGVFGEGIFGLTSIVLVLKETGSILEIGNMMAITLVPSIVLAPLTGVLLDRFNRLKIVIACNLTRVIVIGLFPVSYFFHFFSLPLFSFCIFISYIAWYVLEPAKESVLKAMLEEDQYVQGISIVQGAWQVGLLTSAIFAGALMKWVGTPVTLFITAFIFLISGILYYQILRIWPNSRIIKYEEMNVSFKYYLQDISSGVRYLLQNQRVLAFSLITSMILPFFYAINILIAPFSFEQLSGTELTMGIIDSAAGIGSLISAIFCMSLVLKKNLSIYIIFSILLGCGSLLFFSHSNNLFTAFVFYGLVGFFVGNVKVMTRTQIYMQVEDAFIGRTMTTISMISLLLSLGASYLFAFLGEHNLIEAYGVITLFMIIPLVISITIYFNTRKSHQISEEYNVHNKA